MIQRPPVVDWPPTGQPVLVEPTGLEITSANRLGALGHANN
jgi:hypothetical protein